MRSRGGSGGGADAAGTDGEAFLSGLRQRIEEYGKDVNKLRRAVETAKNARKFDRDPENDILSLVQCVESGNEDIHSKIKRLSQLRFQPTTRSDSADLLNTDNSWSRGRLSSKHVVLSKKLRKDFQKIEARATELRDNATLAIEDFKRRAIEYASRKENRRRRRQLQQRGGGRGRQWIAASLDSDESSEDVDDDAREAMQLLQESANVESDLKLEESLLQQRHSSIKNLFGKMVQVQDTFAELNNLIAEQEPDVESIGDNMVTTEHHAEQGYRNVVEAAHSYRGKRKWLLCWLFCATVALVVLVVLFVVFGPFANRLRFHAAEKSTVVDHVMRHHELPQNLQHQHHHFRMPSHHGFAPPPRVGS